MGTSETAPGREGGISEYPTKAGPRVPDQVPGRCATTGRNTSSSNVATGRGGGQPPSALRAEIRRSETGEWINPSNSLSPPTWPNGSTVSGWRPARWPATARTSGCTSCRSLGAARSTGSPAPPSTPGCARWRSPAAPTAEGGLSPRTVRYVYTIMRVGPRRRRPRTGGWPSTRPTGPPRRPRRRPGRRRCTPGPPRSSPGSCSWADDHDSTPRSAWRLLAYTGMRRGEALALRWRDVDLDAAGSPSAAASAWSRTRGRGEELVEGATKTGQSRVVDLDAGTVAALRAYRAVRGSVALDLVRDTALVLGTLDGRPRHPERFSRRFVDAPAPGAQGAGGGAVAGHPAARPPAHPRDAAAGRRRAGQGRLRAARTRQRHDHPHRLPARPPRHGPAGRRPVRRPARGLRAAQSARSITAVSRGDFSTRNRNAGPLTCRDPGSWCPRGDLNPHAR